MKILVIPPKYRLTKKIAQSLNIVDRNRGAIDNINIPIELEQNLREESIMGSSLYSARVEGNPIRADQIAKLNRTLRGNKNLLEIANLNRAYNLIWSQRHKKVSFSPKDFIDWHKVAMKGLISGEYYGCFRDTEEGIFDQMGNAVYHAPPAKYVPELIAELIKFLNSPREKLNPIKAVLAHLVLEKIHPFVDGSGRVGRLLQFAVMVSQGYGMKGLAYVEEYIDKNRPLYYQAIENSNGADSTGFVELIADFLAQATTTAKDRLVDRMKNFEALDLLPPRRREMVQIIRDHQMVSLDFLHRRFLEVDPRLLRYDLLHLVKLGHIKKLGKTRGALYAPK